MRVTNNMVTDLVLRNINQGLTNIQKLQMQLASNKAILEASDDPVGSTVAMGLKAAIAARTQYQKNADNADGRLSAADTALTGLQSLLTTVRGVALKGADESNGQSQRDSLADQVNQSLEELYDVSMSRYGTDYLFGGTEVATPPYSVTRAETRPASLTSFNAVTAPTASLGSAGLPGTVSDGSFTVAVYNAAGAVTASGTVTVTAGSTSLSDVATALTGLGVTATVGGDNRLSIAAPAGSTFQLSNDTSGAVAALGLNTFVSGEIEGVTENPKGVSGQQRQEILEGVTMASNVTAPEVFGQNGDLFHTLIGLRDALRANNTAAISASLATLDAGVDQASAAQSSVGSREQRIASAQDTLADDLTRLNGLLSQIQDTDVAKTTVDLQQQQQIFQASLSAAAKMIQPSLLDYLS